jgi:uncharacterized protein YggE
VIVKFISLFPLVFALVAPTAATAQTFDSKPFLSVQGHAEAKVKPDVFPMIVTLKDLGMDAAKSQKVVEELASTVLAAGRASGVGDADTEVGNLDVSPETEWDDDKDVEIFKGNSYERTIKLRFHSLDSLRQFIEKMPMSRNLRLETGTFEYSDAPALKRKLRREAIEDARKGAQDMAAAVGKRLLDLFNVSDRAQSTIYAASGYSYQGDGYARGNGASLNKVAVVGAQAIRGSSIVLREGEITVSADAFLVYLIGN